jgi:hypothetical protein
MNTPVCAFAVNTKGPYPMALVARNVLPINASYQISSSTMVNEIVCTGKCVAVRHGRTHVCSLLFHADAHL